MHIKSVYIHNFRNFKDTNFNFEKGFQTIIGENNVGKSNLYYAIRLVLDKGLSYDARKLEKDDFHGFQPVSLSDYILIGVDFEGVEIASLPVFHCIKTSETTARVIFVYAHKNKFKNLPIEEKEFFDKKDFEYRLFCGGDSFSFDDVKNLNILHFSDIEGINLFYISDFRNIYRDLHGNSRSLLNKYCLSRSSSKDDLKAMQNILFKASDELNELSFIPEIQKDISKNNVSIAGSYFSVPISLAFLSEFDEDVWGELNLYFNPNNKKVPISSLGLGQKNILYLSLFIAELENKKDENELNILLIEEPEAHLHPQLQKVLFKKLGNLETTQVFMTSHSTHIASDCETKNLCVIYKNIQKSVKSCSPFFKRGDNKDLDSRQENLLKRYLDATRSELFFSSAVILVEGVAEQFVIPAICKEKYGFNLTEYNISLIPIHSRDFSPFLKIFQENNLEIPVVAIIDGDNKELDEDETETETTAVSKAKSLEITNRVMVFNGVNTLETDVFPFNTNTTYLKICFENLGHKTSYSNLLKQNKDAWNDELIKRIDGTVKKGRFAQELVLHINKDFIIPEYIDKAIRFIAKAKNITLKSNENT
jgi:putative ATP-dependent endonuclease of OLD family